MSTSPESPETCSAKVTISLPPSLVAKITKFAEDERRSRSNAIVCLVEDALAAREQQKRAS